MPHSSDRLAVYYAPAIGSPLDGRAALWLGRDAAGSPVSPGDCAGLGWPERAPFVESPARYGFHATLRPPMALVAGSGRETLIATLAPFAAHAPVPVGRLEVASVAGFVALVPLDQSEALTRFAQDIVEATEFLRRPAGEAERARRRAAGLSAREEELLDRFGYPYVAERFRFHMTLTGRLGPDDVGRVLAAARRWFAPVLDEPVMLDRLVVFAERGAGGPFVRQDEIVLGGGRA